MKRLHLIELEDQPWFPHIVREYMTDFLQLVANRVDFYREIAPYAARGLWSAKSHRIVDLCSGGGGPWQKLGNRLLKKFPDLQIVLTDKYPTRTDEHPLSSLPSAVLSFDERSIDARDVPRDLIGLRTMFLSFHHFRPADAREILQGAVDLRQPILIVEAQKRDWQHVVQFLFSPLMVLLMTPLIRPFRWSRLLLTYLIPLVPVCTLWDGVVSALRTYTVEEMDAMAQSVTGSNRFHWQSGELKSGSVSNLFLLAIPTRDSQRPA